MTDRDTPILNIEGDLVALGPLRREHIPLYLRWINDFGTTRMLGIPPRPMTLEQETAWFEQAAVDGDRPALVQLADRERRQRSIRFRSPNAARISAPERSCSAIAPSARFESSDRSRCAGQLAQGILVYGEIALAEEHEPHLGEDLQVLRDGGLGQADRRDAGDRHGGEVERQRGRGGGDQGSAGGAGDVSGSRSGSFGVPLRISSSDFVGSQPSASRIFVMSGTRRCMSSKPSS